MGARTIPGGLLEHLRLTAPLQTVTLNAGTASAAPPDLRIIESISMVEDGLKGECCAVGIQVANNAGTAIIWGEWWNAPVSDGSVAAPATPTAIRAFLNTPTLWERGTTMTFYTVGGTGAGSAVVSYRAIDVDVARQNYGYIPSNDGT